MKEQIIIPDAMPEPEIFPNAYSDKSSKSCPYCGQSKIPFKLGVCICGAQIGNIQYVKDSNTYVKNWYSYVGNNSSKVQKLGIAELMDNWRNQ